MLYYKNYTTKILVAIIITAMFYWINNNNIINRLYYTIASFAAAPSKLMQQTSNYFTNKDELIHKIHELKTQNQILQTKIYRLASIQNQNKQLRQLLSSSSNTGGDFIVAQLITEIKNPSLFHMAINKGQRDSLYLGQPVLDGYGVIGQVVKIFHDMSIVQVILDSKSAVPIRIGKNTRGILIGNGANKEMQIIDINNPKIVNVGDIVYTSGLGLKFPEGYPVGVVSKVIIIDKYKHQIMVQPSAHIFNSNQFLLIWPENFIYKNKINKAL